MEGGVCVLKKHRFKKLNMMALILLIVGQTVLGPMATVGAVSADPGSEHENVNTGDIEASGEQSDKETNEGNEELDEGEVGGSGENENINEVNEVNKENLKVLLDDAKNYNEDDFTADSYAEFVSAVTSGQQVYENEDATEEDVNDAVNEIENAIAALQEKKPESKEGEGGDSGKEDESNIEDGNSDSDENEENQELLIQPFDFGIMSTYEDMDDSNISSVTLNIEGQAVELTPSPVDVDVKNGDTANFRIELKDLPANHDFGPGTTLTVSLPDVFTGLQAGVKTNLGDITFSDNSVIFIINNEILDEFGTPGAAENIYFEFSATFNKTSGGLDDQVTIPGGAILDLNFTPKDGEQIVKNRISDEVQQNADSIEWEVIVNTDYGAPESGNVNFEDNLDAGHKFKDEDVTVQEIQIGPDGGPNDYTNVGAAQDKRPNYNGNLNQMTLPLDGGKAYKVTYKTYPEDPGNETDVWYSNSATYNNGSPTTASAKIEYDPPLEKTASGPNSSNLETTWTIKVNHNERVLGTSGNNIIIEDTWTTTGGSGDKEQELVGSIVVHNETTNTPATKGTDYEINSALGDQGIEVEFLGEFSDAYTITYTTKPTGDTFITSDMTVLNEVTRSDEPGTFEDDASVTYNKTSFMLIKEAVSVDYTEAKTMKWKITANQAGYTLPIGTVFEDRFTPSNNQELIVSTLSVKDSNNVDITNNFDIINSTQAGFDLTLTQPITEQITIEYETKYDIKDTGENNRTYRNDITIKDHELTMDDPTDGDAQTIIVEQTKNGKKDGKYNYEMKRFEWEVEFNFNYNTFTNAIFEDEISNLPETLEQTIENIVVTPGTLDADGEFQPGTPIEVPNTATEPNKIRLVLGDINQPYKVTYESKIMDDVIPETPGKLAVTNEATLTDNGTPNASWTKTVHVNYTDKLINKTGSQILNTAGIKWSFEFNYAQSHLENIVITDDVGKDADGNPNQFFIKDSFNVYEVGLSGESDSGNYNAATVASTPLDESEYELDIDIKNDTFELKLPDGDQAYFVEYETVYQGDNGEEVKNQVEAKYESIAGNEASSHFTFSSFSYSGGGNVIKVPFVVIKADGATGAVMTDIDFTLYHKATDNELISGTTDTNGIFDIGISLSEATYYLTEDNVPPGYDDPGQIEFTLDRDSVVTSGPHAGKQIVEVKNFEENYVAPICPNFTLTVKDVDGQPVTSKDVELTNTITGQIVRGTTNGTGQVDIPRDELPAGSYDVIEVDSGGNEVQKLGAVSVNYSDDCEAEVQPAPTCPIFTITVKDETGPVDSGISITVKDGDDIVATGTTNVDGKIELLEEDYLPAGSYDVYENKLFIGKVKITYLNDNCEAEVDRNVPNAGTCPNFTLTLEERNGKPREGVTVTVKTSDGVTAFDGTTNADGKIVYNQPLEPGNYVVYNENGSQINTFKVNSECEAVVKPRSSGGGGGTPPKPAPTCDEFTITVKENGTPVDSGEYTFTSEDGKTTVTGTVDSDGKIVFDRDDLPKGDYTVTDEDDNEVGTITVEYTKESCETELDKNVPSPVCDEFTVIMKEDGTPVESGDYTFTSEDGETTVTGSVDSDGKIVIDRSDLPEGTYTVTDKEGNKVGEIKVVYTAENCGTELDTTKPVDPTDPTDPDPEDPTDPSYPSDPGEEPGHDPNDPDISDETDEQGDPGKPNQSGDPKAPGQSGDAGDKGKKGDQDGHVLPNTATNMFNYALIGVVILFAGLLLLRLNRRREQ